MNFLGTRRSQTGEHTEQLIDGCFSTGSNVVHSVCSLPYGGQVRFSHIVDEYEVARLTAVSINNRLLVVQHLLDEDGDNPCFSLWILSRPIHVGIPEADHRNPACPLE